MRCIQWWLFNLVVNGESMFQDIIYHEDESKEVTITYEDGYTCRTSRDKVFVTEGHNGSTGVAHIVT